MQTPWTKTTETTLLDNAIERLFILMQETAPTHPDYATYVDQLSKLHKLQEEEKTSKKHVSPDTLAMIGGNLAGILAILYYEKSSIVLSKALGFVIKSVR